VLFTKKEQNALQMSIYWQLGGMEGRSKQNY